MRPLARATGLEPATTGSTVRYSNQIELHPLAGTRPPLTAMDRAKDSIPPGEAVKTFPFFSKAMHLGASPAIFPPMGPPQKWIVFCADDLGISAGTNEGIRRAFEAGLVRESSLCVTGKAWEEGLDLVRSVHPELGMGLHLSFTLGKALTGPIPHLTDENGIFHPLPQVLKACIRKRLDPQAIEAEIRAQMERACLGVPLLTHFNGHHHVHVFPQIRDMVIKVLRQTSIPWIRLPIEAPQLKTALSPRRLLLARFGKKFRRMAPDLSLPPEGAAFLGLSGYNQRNYQGFFLKQIDRLRSNKAEWMVHPRVEDGDFAALDHHKRGEYSNFAKECQTLADSGFVDKVLSRGIRPSRFGEIG